MPKKIYKYKPLSEFLFKELYYSELYFASFNELNDPLDLKVILNFKTEDKHGLNYLLSSLIKFSIFFASKNYSELIKKDDLDSLVKFLKNNELRLIFCEKVIAQMPRKDFISYSEISECIKNVGEEYHVILDFKSYENELARLTKVFFENSYIACFSETYNDFLMWSHYSSKHTGICLEFSLNENDEFPHIITEPRKLDYEKYSEKMSEWNLSIITFWSKIQKVKYQNDIPTINYYDFSPAFENEADCDLINLSKSKWHDFAFALVDLFCYKTQSWAYEKEWRAIDIKFGKEKIPEERISHYPVEALSKVFFGVRTPSSVKERIYKIINKKNDKIKFFEAILSDSQKLDFKEWHFDEE